jgi:hypothetical protein
VKIKGAPREVEKAEDERESEDTPEKWFREEVGRRRGTRERREGEWSRRNARAAAPEARGTGKWIGKPLLGLANGTRAGPVKW